MPKFTRAEFDQRLERARRAMTEHRLDGIMVTSEPNIEYLSGFTSQFPWSSPSRPWYFVLPREGEATAVIPTVGIANWRATSWCPNIESWISPRPEDEGLDLLAGAVAKIPRRFGRFGVELGPETRLGMPVADLLSLRDAIAPSEMTDCSGVMRELRIIKSPAEVARIRQICQIACDAFDVLPKLARPGDTEKDVVRKFQSELLLRGADKTPYTAIGSGPGGYSSIIMGPTTRKLRKGDVFLIDTGSRYEGYFCDFNRNVAIGRPSDAARRVHELLWRATEAGIKAARPGNSAADLYRAQASVIQAGGIEPFANGRFGHGVGKVMTEPPSNKLEDTTVLKPGMVLTIEPVATYGRGQMHVHEENLVVTEDKPVLLSRRAPKEMPVARL